MGSASRAVKAACRAARCCQVKYFCNFGVHNHPSGSLSFLGRLDAEFPLWLIDLTAPLRVYLSSG